MAIDNAIYISELDETLPQNSDPRAEGAGQMRATKRALVNTFPNLNGEVTATHDQLNHAATVNISRGMILDWFGPYQTPPENWAFCDGSTLTLEDGTLFTIPDLRDRFVKSVAFNEDGDVVENVGDVGGNHSGIQKHSHKHTHDKGTMKITGLVAPVSQTLLQSTIVSEGALGRTDDSYSANGTPDDADGQRVQGIKLDTSLNGGSGWTGVTSEDATEVGTEGGNQPAYMVLAKIIFVGPYTA